jgi:dipeptidyl aminopeptidase/acylaminoacyl peptidase
MSVTPEEITDGHRPRDIRISPDGQRIVYALSPQCRKQKEVVSSLWMAKMGEANSSRQLTPGTFNDVAPEFSPDGRYISFISDRAHAGITSTIYLLPTEDHGESLPLTSTENKKPIGGYQWSPDGKYIAFTGADEDSEEKKEKRQKGDDARVWGEDWGHARLRLVDVNSKNTTTVVKEQAHVSSLAWSSTGEHLAYTLLPSHSAEHMVDGGDIYVVNIQNRITRKIHHYPTWIRDLNWLDDDLAWVGVQDGESVWSSDSVWRWVSSTGQAAKVAYGETNCARGLRRCGKQLVAYAQEGLTDILEPFSGKRILSARWDIGAGWDVSEEGRLAVCRGLATGDEVISIIDGQQVQLSSHNKILSSTLSYKALAIETQTQDGLPLDGMLYIPARGHKPYPAVVISHGGPYWRATEGTDPTSFSWTPWLLSLGCAVLHPNYRGGSSHGAHYAEAVIGDPSVSYQDVVAFTKHCISQHNIDGTRVVSAGWSYGGYLTNLALTRDKTFHFAAGIAGAGTSCWDTKVLTSDVPTFQGALTGVLSWKTPMYAGTAGANSPIKHLDGVKSPLLILHGEEDVRVPVSQAKSFHLALRAGGHTPEMVIYPREGHSVWEQQHVIHMLRTMEEFLRKHVPQTVEVSSSN